MRNKFVNTSNVERFLTATGAIEQRAAREACIVLVSGDAGLGKSKAGEWWALKNDAVFVRLKAACTPKWLLTDLVMSLGEQAPASQCEKLFNQAVGFLAKNPRPIVVDEVENGINQIKVLETIRDIGDMVDVPVIFLGREFVWGKLQRLKHFKTRIGARADFTKATKKDVQLCVNELCEVEVDPAVIDQIHIECEGHIREIIKAINNIERVGLRNKGHAVTLEMIGKNPLTHDWSRTQKRAVA